VFLLLLCETAKKARPAGHNQLAIPAKKTLGGNAEQKRQKQSTTNKGEHQNCTPYSSGSSASAS